MLDYEDEEFSIFRQCEMLGINRSNLYYKSSPPSEKEISIKHRMDEIYTNAPYYGARRILALLLREGFNISRPTVSKYMKEMGIFAIYPGPNLSKRNQEHKIYPYLLRNLKIDRPNQVWGTDITYIRLKHGWMYLVAFLDWHSRYIVSWELDQSLEIEFVLAAMNNAFKIAIPEIINSDQGSHFTSPQFTAPFLEAGCKISMDGKGRALDNIFTERLWRSIKYEEVYLKDYANPREAREGITEYIYKYNNERPHQSLDYKTPAEVYFKL